MTELLFTSDIHLTANPADEYRWKIFEHMAAAALDSDDVAFFFGGDTFDRKDHHPSALVNRFVNCVMKLKTHGPVYFLMGNHDYVDPAMPFLRFLNRIPDVYFVRKPIEVPEYGIYLLPHSRTPSEDWAAFSLKEAHVVLLHQTFKGAKVSEAHSMTEGMSLSVLDRMGVRKDAIVLSGDVHVPQKLGRVNYIGSPHPVHFGDDWPPTIVRLRPDEQLVYTLDRIPLKGVPKKARVEIVDMDALDGLPFKAGDMVVVAIKLPRSKFHEWEEQKKAVVDWAAAANVVLCGVELVEKGRKERAVDGGPVDTPRAPLDVLQMFVKERNIDPDLGRLGEDLLLAVTKE